LFAVALLALVAVYFVARTEKETELKKAAAAAQAEAEAAPQPGQPQGIVPMREVAESTPVAEEAPAQPVAEEVPPQPVLEKATTPAPDPVSSSVVLEPSTDIYAANREQLRLSAELRNLHSQVREMEQRLSTLNEMAASIEGSQERESGPHFMVAMSEDEFEKYENSFDKGEEITERLAVVRNPVTEDIGR
jgi:hypothetical protein